MTSLTPMLISIAEVGRTLGLGRTRVYQLIDEGALETVHIGNRHLVRMSSVQALVEYAASKRA